MQIYPGITKVDQDFGIQERWSLSDDHGSIFNGKGEKLEMESGVSPSNRSLKLILQDKNNNTFQWVASKENVKIRKAIFVTNEMLER